MGNNQNPKKYSEILHEFMFPIIDEVIHDEKLLSEMLEWGQMVWNKAVAEDFPDNPKSKDIEDFFYLLHLQIKVLLKSLLRERRIFLTKMPFLL